MKKQVKGLMRATIGASGSDTVIRMVRYGKILSMRSVKPFMKSRDNNGECLMKMEAYGDADLHVFFGYYDITPINYDDTKLLAMRVALDKKDGDHRNLNLGYYTIGDKKKTFHQFGKTETWCWQQGCRLQWYPLNQTGKNKLVIYNRLNDGRLGCCIQNINTKKILQYFDQPIYSVSPEGCYAFFLNFSRLQRLRPGYGYGNISDESITQKAPETDGLWRLDVTSGAYDLLISLSALGKFYPHPTMAQAEHYLNHISVNPEGTRILFFHIWVENGIRHTRLLTSDIDGSRLYPLVNEGHVSHYAWRTSSEILCFSTHADTGMNYHLYKDRSTEREIFASNILKEDGHPSFSPDLGYLLTDTYPDKFGERTLLLYNCTSNSLMNLGAFFNPFIYYGETRCDLHPRWSTSGDAVIIDSSHEGRRAMYVLNLNPHQSA